MRKVGGRLNNIMMLLNIKPTYSPSSTSQCRSKLGSQLGHLDLLSILSVRAAMSVFSGFDEDVVDAATGEERSPAGAAAPGPILPAAAAPKAKAIAAPPSAAPGTVADLLAPLGLAESLGAPFLTTLGGRR